MSPDTIELKVRYTLHKQSGGVWGVLWFNFNVPLNTF